jgi:hypothetical protein
MLPQALGGKQVWTSMGKEWVEGVITDPTQVKDFELPSTWAGRTGQVLKRAQALLREVPDGDMIRCPDILAPLGVAELL